MNITLSVGIQWNNDTTHLIIRQVDQGACDLWVVIDTEGERLIAKLGP